MTEIIQWSPGVTLEAIEKQVVLKAWHWYRGNKTQCSISLGINVRTLERKLEEYEQAGLKQRELEEREQLEREAILKRQRGVVPGSETEQGGARIYGTSSGVQVQPTSEVSAQQPVPVQERKEVQSVLPKHTPPVRDRPRGR